MKDIRRNIYNADAVLILAGAGFSADSGLPTFRGTEGFWRAYPPLRGRAFSQVSSPDMLFSSPKLFQGFYLHRLKMYRDTAPHVGYGKLLGFLEAIGKDYFVVTTNVDGHFLSSGFDKSKVYEIHGSIHSWQCNRYDCESAVFDAPKSTEFTVSESLIPSREIKCPTCGESARPNILMFNDFEFSGERVDEQAKRFNAWRASLEFRSKNVVVLELGAGKAIPTLRYIHNSFLSLSSNNIGFRVNTDPQELHISRANNQHLISKTGLEFISELAIIRKIIV